MVDVGTLVRSHGGLIATHELYAEGHDRYSVAVLVRQRELVRVRQGWYCSPGLAPPLLRAARVGGLATCRTALQVRGVWVWPDAHLHVVVPPHAVRLRTARSPLLRRRITGDPDTIVHWRDATPSTRLIADPLDAVIDLARCGSPDEIEAAADSLLHLGLTTRSELRRAAVSLPAAARDAALAADGVCESGIETLVWRMLRSRRIAAARQARIAGVGKVDFVVGDRLVIEVDGEAYHTDPVAFENDRRRDTELAIRGFRTLRFSYAQVRNDISRVEEAITASLRGVDE